MSGERQIYKNMQSPKSEMSGQYEEKVARIEIEEEALSSRFSSTPLLMENMKYEVLDVCYNLTF